MQRLCQYREGRIHIRSPYVKRLSATPNAEINPAFFWITEEGAKFAHAFTF